jgi:6-phosphogluconolactonase
MRTIKDGLSILFVLLLAGALSSCGGGGESESIDATISVTVKGLQGSGLILRNNLGDDLSIPNDGTFSFSKTVSTGSPYSVTIKAPPANPSQVCGLVNETSYASGIVELDPNISVYVRCVVPIGFAYVANYFSNTISAFAIDSSGAMASVVGSPFAAGNGPKSIAVDSSSNHLYVANHADGANNVSAYSINTTTGALVPVVGSPFASGLGPASVAIHPSGKFAFVANDASNNVTVYTINGTTGALAEISGSPFSAGLGPTSVGFAPTGKFAYVTNGLSNNVSVFAVGDTTGTLTDVAGSPFVAGTKPQAVATDPMGKFVYVTNYQSQDISAYSADPNTGALMTIPGSPFASVGWPLSMVIAPSGKFAYVGHDAAGISVYSIDPGSGKLTQLAPSTYVAYPAVVVAPSGSHVYATHATSNSNHEDAVGAYTIDPGTGTLTHVDAWPYTSQDETAGVGALSMVLMIK